MPKPKLPISQSTQISNSTLYDDNLTLDSTLETLSESLEDDLNSIRSQLKAIIGGDHWYDVPGTSVGGGINAVTHKSLDQLVHNIAEDSFMQLNRTDGKIATIIIWNSSDLVIKIRDFIVTRTNGKISQIITNQYDSFGVITETLTQDINRTNNRVVSITNTKV